MHDSHMKTSCNQNRIKFLSKFSNLIFVLLIQFEKVIITFNSVLGKASRNDPSIFKLFFSHVFIDDNFFNLWPDIFQGFCDQIFGERVVRSSTILWWEQVQMKLTSCSASIPYREKHVISSMLTCHYASTNYKSSQLLHK